MIATWRRRIVQGDMYHLVDCSIQWNVGFSTTGKPEELAYWRSIQVVGDTPQVVVCRLVVVMRISESNGTLTLSARRVVTVVRVAPGVGAVS